MPMFGYARVSTRDQDLAGQVAELTGRVRQDLPGEGLGR